MSCPKCGCTAIHACTGKPFEPMSEERQREFYEAIAKIIEQEDLGSDFEKVLDEHFDELVLK